MLAIRKIFNPPMFQGNLKKKFYFEGWYFKIVDPTEKKSYAFIPGISLDKAHNTSHSFIQLLNGTTGETFYFEYSLKEFSASPYKFEVKVGQNYFSQDKIKISIHQQGHDIEGELRFKNLVPWPKTLSSPGVMGPFTYIPIMECYHGLISMNHDIEGKITFNKELVDFTNGLGYIEKDWGKSFPSGYIWLQTNHFTKEKASFMASIAKIPLLGTHFIGFLFVLWYNGKVYPFTTYTGTKIQGLTVAPNRVKAAFADKNYLIVFDARKVHKEGRKAPIAQAGVLKSPTLGEMKGRIMESLTSEATVTLYGRENGGKKKKLIFSDTGYHAGLEIEATKEALDF
ncbi:MAG: hypothetical protein LUQ65_14660 [Candidatus Helarchaeota archaeon]|nr:hypothetical protein [Candidatus Helarchaeota archaeon]